VKRQFTEWKKIFARYSSAKGWISTIYKEHKKLNNNKNYPHGFLVVLGFEFRALWLLGSTTWATCPSSHMIFLNCCVLINVFS
jgi:hypothetical protein